MFAFTLSWIRVRGIEAPESMGINDELAQKGQRKLQPLQKRMNDRWPGQSMVEKSSKLPTLRFNRTPSCWIDNAIQLGIIIFLSSIFST
jgi:hypothetical protein